MKNEISILICDCGGSLGDKIDFEEVGRQLKTQAVVGSVRTCSDLCKKGRCAGMVKGAERVVIAACDEWFDGAGVKEGLVDCVNVREYCGWVTKDKKAATSKCVDMLSGAVRRMSLAEPFKIKKVSVNQDVVIIGSGVAAMQTAVAVSSLGHKVVIVSSDKELGGSAAKNPQLYAYIGEDIFESESMVADRVEGLAAQIKNDKNITVKTNAVVTDIDGECGNFAVTVGKSIVNAGSVVLAVGAANEISELSKLVHGRVKAPKSLAIVMDMVAEQGRDMAGQVLSAAMVMKIKYGTEVKIYCRSMRTAAAGLEKLYTDARDNGVVIVKYDSKPVVVDDGQIKYVTFAEGPAGIETSEEFDMIVRADAKTTGYPEIKSMLSNLKVRSSDTLQIDSVWAYPAESNIDGVYVVGAAKSNSEFRDAQSDGLAAAGAIHELLKDKQIEITCDAAVVDNDKCVACLTCVRSCPVGAISFDESEKAALISELTCKRCGVCTIQCPAGAIELPRFTTEQIEAEVGERPRVTVFACENSAYPAARSAAVGIEIDAQVKMVKVPCAGKVDPKEVLRELACGADKVKIIACHQENCKYINGSTLAARRFAYIQDMMDKAGLDKEKVSFGELASVEANKFIELVKE